YGRGVRVTSALATVGGQTHPGRGVRLAVTDEYIQTVVRVPGHQVCRHRLEADIATVGGDGRPVEVVRPHVLRLTAVGGETDLTRDAGLPVAQEQPAARCRGARNQCRGVAGEGDETSVGGDG